MMGILLMIHSFVVAETTKEYKKESDGFEWYQIRTDDWKYGAEDKNHKAIIRPEYDMIYYSEIDNGFHLRKGRYNAYFDMTGKCIIPLSRKYRGDMYWLTMTDDDTGNEYRYLSVKSPKYTIICDVKGKEILRTIRFESLYPRCCKGRFFYEAKDDFGKYGIIDGDGELVLPFVSCNTIFPSGDSLKTEDCFRGEYISLAPLDTIKTLTNYLQTYK
jgi:hypothetical protein